jgi:hypothetical protein
MTSRTFHFSTVVWGSWHTDVFLEVNLPSLLASGNLQAFAERHRVIYRIQTSREDVARIEASPAYQRARQILQCQIVPRIIHQGIDPIGMHHMLWRQAIDEARAAGAMVLFVPPDVVWSNGAFGHIADVAATGKRAIFMTYQRVVSETAVPAVKQAFRDPATGVIDAPSRRLVELAMEHIHPLTLTYVRDSLNFPIHPEFILWRVPGEGYLMRVLVREMFAYDPRHFDLNEQALLAHRPDPDDVHYITDSDDLFSLSLAPLAKDIEWYVRPQRLNTLSLGAWWLRYDSPANDVAAAHYFYVHPGERTPEKWCAAERQSDHLLQRIQGTREVLRVISGLAANKLSYAEQLVAAALVETKLAQFVRPDAAPPTILLPSAAAAFRWLLDDESVMADGESQPFDRRTAARLLHRILDHVVAGNVDLVPGQETVLRTPLGGERRLTWRGDVPLIDGIEMEAPGFSLGRSWCYRVASVLPPAVGARRARTVTAGRANHRAADDEDAPAEPVARRAAGVDRLDWSAESERFGHQLR